MFELIAAALILWLGYSGLRWFARADPKSVAAGARKGAGGALLLVAGFLLVFRGNFETAAAAGALGLWLVGWSRAPAFMRHFRWTEGSIRVLRASSIEIRVDEARGEMSGTVTAGPFAGRSLNTMSRAECAAQLAASAAFDPEGARFLQYYVDRRFSGWGAAGEAHEDARGQEQRRRASAMTEEDAYQMLGLAKGASREEIARAHRALMKKVHPDHGGTASLAALLNEAKEVLMQRHR